MAATACSPISVIRESANANLPACFTPSYVIRPRWRSISGERSTDQSKHNEWTTPAFTSHTAASVTRTTRSRCLMMLSALMIRHHSLVVSLRRSLEQLNPRFLDTLDKHLDFGV